MKQLQTQAVFLGIVSLWWLVNSLGWVNGFLLPSPVTVLETLVDLVSSGVLAKRALESLKRAGLGMSWRS